MRGPVPTPSCAASAYAPTGSMGKEWRDGVETTYMLPATVLLTF